MGKEGPGDILGGIDCDGCNHGADQRYTGEPFIFYERLVSVHLPRCAGVRDAPTWMCFWNTRLEHAGTAQNLIVRQKVNMCVDWSPRRKTIAALSGTTFAVVLILSLVAVVPASPSISTTDVALNIYYNPSGFEVPCVVRGSSNSTAQGCIVPNYEIVVQTDKSGWMTLLELSGYGLTVNANVSETYLKAGSQERVYWHGDGLWAVGDHVTVNLSIAPSISQSPTSLQFGSVGVLGVTNETV